MLKNILRIIALLVSFASTASAAQSLEDINDEVYDFLTSIDKQMDTGLEFSNDKFGYGAVKEVAKDTNLNFGVGALVNNTPEYNLSKSGKLQDVGSQTNMIEQKFKPMDSTPMVGVSLGYKF
jgi:hypothetical protein